MARKKTYIPLDWENLSTEQKQQISKQWAKMANAKLSALEKRGGVVTKKRAYRRAKWYLDKYGKKRFSESKKLAGKELNMQLRELEDFLNDETNTYRGIKRYHKKRLERMKELGFNVDVVDPELFGQFMSSNEYKNLRKYVASDQIISDFLDAIPHENYDEIMQEYEEFLNSEMTFEQVDERRKKGKMLK